MRPQRTLLPTFLLCAIAASCSTPLGGDGLVKRPSSGPTSIGTQPISAEVIFTVQAPELTPAFAEIGLILVDEVTGLPYNTRTIPMTRLADGRWQAKAVQQLGSLTRYRYARMDQGNLSETDVLGEGIDYRVVHIQGPTQLTDIITAWPDIPYSGVTGRVVGKITDGTTGEPLQEMIVNAAGLTTFTDGEGIFRLDGLVPGEHRVTVFSPSGSYLPAQQGALVAGGKTTPAGISLSPATPVLLTFELVVPEETAAGTPVRIAGNVWQLGNMFTELSGGMSATSTRLPRMMKVDSSHHIFLATFYSGTDLRYKYTLGDGLWNAERDDQGAFLTRQIVIPDHDLTLSDSVSSWSSRDHGAITFHVNVPEDTPPGETVAIQFHAYNWFEPLPMSLVGLDSWSFTLNGPLGLNMPIGYRFCRNYRCDAAAEAAVTGQDPEIRQVMPDANPQETFDRVDSWQWLKDGISTVDLVVPSLEPRPEVEVGAELVPLYSPSWSSDRSNWLQGIAGIGANAIVLTPTRIWKGIEESPLLSLDPAQAPLSADLESITTEASGLGLSVALRATLRPERLTPDDWWESGRRDRTWWAVWFQEYRSLALTLARQAERVGATKIILGGPEVSPALPGGSLADGTPSGVPPDAELQWRRLVEAVRERFHGDLAFELELGEQPPTLPTFLDLFDQVHLYWHVPLRERGSQGTIAEMQAVAGTALGQLLEQSPLVAEKSLVLSIEYPSVVGGASGCPMSTSGSCLPASAFDQGADPAPELHKALYTQAAAIHAVLLEAYPRPYVTGFYVRRYNPVVTLSDKSASIYGKPAMDVVRSWFTSISSASGD